MLFGAGAGFWPAIVSATPVGGKRAAVLSPFLAGVTFGRGVTGANAHHSDEISFGYGFALDLKGGASTAVYPRIVSGDGAVTMTVMGPVVDNPNNSGQDVAIEVKVDAVTVGVVRYVHLTDVQVAQGNSVTAATRLGNTAPDVTFTNAAGTCKGYQCSPNWQVSTATGIHTHVDFQRACYGSVDENTSAGARQDLYCCRKTIPPSTKLRAT